MRRFVAPSSKSAQMDSVSAVAQALQRLCTTARSVARGGHGAPRTSSQYAVMVRPGVMGGSSITQMRQLQRGFTSARGKIPWGYLS